MSLATIDHHLRTCATRLSITRACLASRGAVQLSAWLTERELRAQVRRRALRRSNLAPIADAGFTLITGGLEATFLLETDMGTVSRERWRERIALYGDTSRVVLTTTPSLKRLQELCLIAEAVSAAKGIDPTRFWFALDTDVDDTSVLVAPIWHVPTVGSTALLPAGTRSPTSHADVEPNASDIPAIQPEGGNES